MTVGESTEIVLKVNAVATGRQQKHGCTSVNRSAGYVSIVLPAGCTVTGGMAAAAARELEELQPPGQKPLLLDVTGVESISRSARAVFGSSRAASAVAVFGVSPVDRVIANFLLGGNFPPFPTKYFTRMDEAVSWLEAHADA